MHIVSPQNVFTLSQNYACVCGVLGFVVSCELLRLIVHYHNKKNVKMIIAIRTMIYHKILITSHLYLLHEIHISYFISYVLCI